MSSKKRLLAVGGVLLVLIGALLAVYLRPKTPAPTPGVDKTVELHRFAETEVTAVTVTRPDATISFYKLPDGSWGIEGRDPAELDAAFVFDTVKSAALLTAIEKLADAVENPADYGLVAPSASISVHGAEGVLSTINFGNKTLDQSAYYVQLSGKPEVYLVASAVAAPFYHTPTQYLKKDVFKTLLNEVSTLTVKHPQHGDVRIVRTGDPEDEGLLGTWAMTAPYQKETRAQNTEDWINAILAITGNDVVEGLTHTAEYGLDSPDVTVTLTTKTGATETVFLSTENRALRKNGQNRVYLLPEAALDFLDTAPFGLLDPFLCKVDITTLDSFSWADNTLLFGETYQLNGKPVSADAVKTAYLELMMITILAPAQASDRAAQSTAPVFTYTFQPKVGETIAVSLYEINPQTYLAEINGKAAFRADTHKVKTAQTALNALLED